MSIIFNSAGIAETMNNGVSNVTGADSIITENYTNVVQHGIKIDMPVEEKTISGTPPLTFNSNGTPLIDYTIYGNAVQDGTPTPDNPIMPQGTGDLETSGAKAGQYKIPISSANTTTPVYLGEIPTTRRIKKLVLTGEEDIEIKSGKAKWYIPIADMKTPTNSSAVEWYCSHYQAVANSASWTSYDYMISWSTSDSGSSIGLRIKDINFSTGVTVADFKSYLAQQYANGTPVTIWYVLARETTSTINEPLMKIGDYADSVSYSQSGVTIPTAVGNNTIDVQTTPKPSDMAIKYKGR